MTSIGAAIGWKFNHQEGMRTINGIITEFPGGIPSQQDQDTWIAEYELFAIKKSTRLAVDALRDIKKNLPILTEGEVVDAGTLSSGAMANEMFAYDGKSMEIDSITRTGNLASITFVKNHHLDTGQSFEISGSDQAEYNGEFGSLVTGKKTLDFAVTGTPVTPATGVITALTKSYRWIDNLNNTVFWSASKFKAIHRDTTKYERDCVQHGRDLKDQVLAASTVSEVETIDINSGWPDTGV